jgi:hypothetical protein
MTYAHLSRLLFTSLVLAVAGCGEKLPDDDTGTATGSASSTGTSSTGSAASSSGDAPTTGADPTGETGTATSGDPTGDPTSGTTSGTTTGESGSSSSGGGSGSTTDGLECTLMDQACAAAEQGGLFEDCGLVLLDDPVEAWQTAQDCALTAIAEQRGFKLITQLQGIDSEVAAAFVGVAQEEYLVEVFFFDGDPCGGGGCGPKITRTICGESVIATQGCVVEPGTICLTCEAAGDSLDVCEGD